MRTQNESKQKLVLIILFHYRPPDLALAAVGGALGWRYPGAGRVHLHQVPQQPPTGIDGTGSKKEDSAGQTPLLPRSTLLPHAA
jgi:hypothetical protein